MKPCTTISALFRRWIFVGILCFVASQQAGAFTFIYDPQTDPANNPFGRVLWNVAPNKERQMVLNYAFVPLQQNEYVWDGSNGQRVKAASRGWTPQQQAAVKRAANTWTAGTGVKNNLVGAPTNGQNDLESTALHEFGHAIGLGHPENTLRTVFNGRNTTHVASPNNLNVNGNPLIEPVPAADKNNIRQSNTLQAEDAQVRPLAQGATGTEAVMIQLSLANEIQRSLAFDDEQGLHALHSGKDFVSNTADDFVIVLREVAYNSGEQQINIVNSVLPFDVGGRTSYSTKRTNLFNDRWRTNPILIDKSLLQLEYTVDLLSGEPTQILGATDAWITYPSAGYGVELGAAHLFLDADSMYAPMPEPSTLGLLTLAAILLSLIHGGQGRRPASADFLAV
jgi:hypothetical protein